jgi:hypothetical protein
MQGNTIGERGSSIQSHAREHYRGEGKLNSVSCKGTL